MVRRIESNGLGTSLVKLNGKLELHFTRDTTFAAQYTLHGADVNDTVEMEHAREAAAGQPVVSLGLEMFVEDAQGFLEVRFNGAIGSTLAFQFDGRDFEDLPACDGNPDRGQVIAPNIASGRVGIPDAQLPTVAPLSDMQHVQAPSSVPRNTKVQTVRRETRNTKTQTMAPSETHAGCQKKRKCMINSSVQTVADLILFRKDSTLFAGVVGHTEQHDHEPVADNGLQERRSPELEIAHTFTNAVATVFQTFNEPRNPHRQKRQAERVADYKSNETKIYGNNLGNGDERLHFQGEQRVRL